MLVNNGDLPTPDTNVLSESLKSAAAAPRRLVAAHGMGPELLISQTLPHMPMLMPVPSPAPLHNRQHDSSSQHLEATGAIAAASLSYFSQSSDALQGLSSRAPLAKSPRASITHTPFRVNRAEPTSSPVLGLDSSSTLTSGSPGLGFDLQSQSSGREKRKASYPL